MGFFLTDELAGHLARPDGARTDPAVPDGRLWGELDYLVIDLPPGTGDAALTLTQMAPLSGAVIVTTANDLSLIDARKGLQMFEKVNVPVLGIVENMSYFTPPELPDKKYYIFGEGGGKRTAEEIGVDFLGEVPITFDPGLRTWPIGLHRRGRNAWSRKLAVLSDERTAGRRREHHLGELSKLWGPCIGVPATAKPRPPRCAHFVRCARLRRLRSAFAFGAGGTPKACRDGGTPQVCRAGRAASPPANRPSPAALPAVNRPN